MALTFEILVLARNEAAAGLEAANRDVKKAYDELGQAASRGNTTLVRQQQNLQTEFGQTSRIVRATAGEFLSTLNPALGQTVQVMGQAATAAKGLSAATGVLVLGLAGAGVVASQWITRMNEMIDKQAALNVAVRSFDTGAIRGQINSAILEMEKAQLRINAIREGMAPSGFRERAIAPWREFMDVFKDPSGSLTTWLGQMTGLEKATTDLGKARSALAQALPLEREITLSAIFKAQDAALQGLNATTAQRAIKEADIDRFIQQHEKMLETLGSEADESERLLKAQAQRDLAKATGGAAEVELVNKALRENLELLGIQMATRFDALRLSRQEGEAAIRARNPAFAQVSPADTGITDADIRAAQVDANKLAGEALELRTQLVTTERERVEVLTQIEGLNAKDQAALDLSIQAGRERLRLKEAELEIEKAQLSGDPRRVDIATGRRDLVVLEESVRRRNLIRSEAERTDFATGAAKGFSDVLDEMESFGRDGERVVREFATSTNNLLSDLLFAPMTDNWQKTLVDAPKRFLQSIGREITDVFAKMATKSILEGAGKLFPGLTMFAGSVLGTGAVPGTSAAGQLQAAVSGQQQGVLASVTRGQGITVPSTGAVTYDVLGVNRLTGQPVLVGPGGQITSMQQASQGVDLASLGIPDPSAGAGSGIGITSGGFGLGQAAGGLAGLAALGGLAYSNLTTPPPPGDPTARILTSAASGALSGALAGVPFAASTYGVSIFVGAVVGAFIGAGTSAAPKGSDPEVVAARNQGRSREARNIYDQMSRAINTAGTIDEGLRTPLNQFPANRPGPFDPAPFAPGSAAPGLPPGVPAPPPNFQGPPPFDQSGGG